MANAKIVVRFNDGGVLKGTTLNFDPNASDFVLTTEDAKYPSGVVPVEMQQVKALFFVRSFVGKPDRPDRPALECEQPYAGRKIEVVFNDGERVVGSTPDCRPEMPGFYLFPSDIGDNTLKMFVVTSSIRSIRWLEGVEQRSGRDRRSGLDRRSAQAPAEGIMKLRSSKDRRSAYQRRHRFGARSLRPQRF